MAMKVWNAATGKTEELAGTVRTRRQYVPYVELSYIGIGRIYVVNSYEIRDQLKAAGFRFDGNQKAWYIDAKTDEAQRQAVEKLAALGCVAMPEDVANDIDWHGPVIRFHRISYGNEEADGRWWDAEVYIR